MTQNHYLDKKSYDADLIKHMPTVFLDDPENNALFAQMTNNEPGAKDDFVTKNKARIAHIVDSFVAKFPLERNCIREDLLMEGHVALLEFLKIGFEEARKLKNPTAYIAQSIHNALSNYADAESNLKISRRARSNAQKAGKSLPKQELYAGMNRRRSELELEHTEAWTKFDRSQDYDFQADRIDEEDWEHLENCCRTDREQKFVALLRNVRGDKTKKEIAEEIGCSVKAMDAQVEKLNARFQANHSTMCLRKGRAKAKAKRDKEKQYRRNPLKSDAVVLTLSEKK